MIRKMQTSDWARVKAIYEQALAKGVSTFNTVCPDYTQWDSGHLRECRYVAEVEGRVAGWIAISPTSSRETYKGVVEVSVYVDDVFQGRGIGTELLQKVCTESEAQGIWCLYAAIFAINRASITLHRKCGFREIGFRERIAKDRFGNWQDTILMERRLPA